MAVHGNKTKLQTTFQQFKRCWQLHLFLLLPIIYIIVFAYYPMFGAQIAFKDFMPAEGIWGSQWVGFKHFATFLKSHQFGRVVTNTLRISLYSLFAGFPLPIIFALFLNAVRNQRFKKFVQTVTYMPHFISVVVIVGMMVQIFNPVIGVYKTIYQLFGGEGYPPNIMGSASSFIHLFVWSGIWQQLGWGSIIYMAALSSVDPELHEAAEIDGASRLKRIVYIDFPSILPTISILLILRVGSIMSVGFEKTYLMQNAMNLKYSEVIATYVYKVGIASGHSNYSYASAIGLFNSVINCTLLILANAASRKMSYTSLW
jgi:putative aldouronate transport system permease protein